MRIKLNNDLEIEIESQRVLAVIVAEIRKKGFVDESEIQDHLGLSAEKVSLAIAKLIKDKKIEEDVGGVEKSSGKKSIFKSISDYLSK